MRFPHNLYDELYPRETPTLATDPGDVEAHEDEKMTPTPKPAQPEAPNEPETEPETEEPDTGGEVEQCRIM